MSDFVHSFLFQNNSITRDGKTVSAAMVMDSGKEGWVGIPHGGIGMGAIAELIPGIGVADDDRKSIQYPMSSSFRMGGSEARVGDRVKILAAPSDAGISGRITVEGTEMPYITGDFSFGDQAPASGNLGERTPV